MVNMNPRGVAAPKLEAPTVAGAAGLQMPGGQGGIATIAQGLGELNATLTDLGNRANVAAGKEEGAVAGLAAAQGGTAPAFRRDGSVRGDAFDQAAMESGLAVLETKLRTDLSDLANNTLDDPAAWQAGADKIVGDTVTALQNRDPQMATQMALIAAQARASGDVNARKRMVELGVSARKSAIDGLIETRGNAVINLARQDHSTPEAQAALTAETEGLIQALVKLGPRGAFEAGGRQFAADETRAGSLMPEQIGTTLRDLTKKVAIESSLGAFDRAPTVKAKREMLAALDGDITKGTGLAATLGVDTARAAFEAMQGRLADAVGAEAVTKNDLVRDLNTLDQIAQSGFAPDATKVTDVIARANALGDADLIAKASELQAVATLSPTLNGMSVPALERWIKNKEAAMARNATPQNLAELGLARDIYGRKLTHIQTSPAEMAAGIPPMPLYSRAAPRRRSVSAYSFELPGAPRGGGVGGRRSGSRRRSGARDARDDDDEDDAGNAYGDTGDIAPSPGMVGKSKLPGITFGAPQTVAQIRTRVSYLEAYSQANGANLSAGQILLGAERTALADSLDQGGTRALDMATAIIQGGGRYGVALLADTSGNGMGLALASALRQRGGRVGDLAAQGQTLFKRGVRMPNGGAAMLRIQNEEYGDMYRGNTQERQAAAWVAGRAYIAMMAARPEAQNQFDPDLWRDVVRASMGVVRERHQDFGGRATYRRQNVQAPAWLATRGFERVWSGLTADDWNAMGIPVFDDSRRGAVTPAGRVPLSVIRRAQPVTHGEGVYLLRFPDGNYYGRGGQRMSVNLNRVGRNIAHRHRDLVR
jgi:hypothetical protein